MNATALRPVTFAQESAQSVKTTVLDPQAEFDAIVGKAVLFIGAECAHWTLKDFAYAAQRARTLGFDSICPRRSNGTIRYYGTPSGLEQEYYTVTAEGCGYVPFGYSYGPRFGPGFATQEASVIQEMIDAIGVARGGAGLAIADLEVEYDYNEEAASNFIDFFIGKPGLLGVTTWANPNSHGWSANIAAMRPYVNCWIPQEYNDFLSHSVTDGMINICPAVDLSQEFGVNHQTDIIHRAKLAGAKSIYFWDYSLTGDIQFVRSLTAIARA